MNKTIGIVAHVDAGKTTFIEQILYITDTIREVGRVDKKNTVLDYHTIEKQRGITVFSDQASLKYNDTTIHIIDTPGHVDFSSEMERSLKILDCAVIIISAVEGIQGHTETVWRLLRQYNIPTIFFINKLDRIGADFYKTYDDIYINFTKDICVFAKPNNDDGDVFSSIVPLFNDTEFDSSVVDFLVERNDYLLEKYLNDEKLTFSELNESIKKQFSSCNIYPCLCGSGLKNIGIDLFLNFIDKFEFTNYSSQDDFGAVVYKIKHHETNNKLTYIKVISGLIKTKDTIIHDINDSIIEEKINQIKVSSGSIFNSVNSLSAGEFGILVGINNSYIGEGLGICNDFIDYSLKPVMQSKVIFDSSLNPKEVLSIFKLLNTEDPSLGVEWNNTLSQLQINVMGVIQLEVLKHEVKERFGIDVNFEEPEILYKETITNDTIGFGHYEPYKHYADVKFKITPAKRNSGISYSSDINHDILYPRWQKLVSKLVVPACRRGILTGSPVTDINIELIKGSAHIKHTSGGDFSQATYRAIRHGLENAQNILLEPYYKFKITAPQELCGRVMTDITKMHGSFSSPVTVGSNSVLEGRIPVASSMNYASELSSFTKGKGNISLVFDGYDVCHNQCEIIEKYNYDNTSDPEFTSNSIYCNKGNVYSIPGNDAEDYRRG
ncbi:small GTP-binding protein [Sedimentibacter acidaminivorans]|uniref:Small GTP-binding protein n=1 Tax=Sedimentibacter acidaminivorans TaxID=913099 RepID=A0ABS4GA27_9FIRM|nr:TetM/TetW/TetO/TetS family tetracycline resistance ribosomal protection protein [Sedimentibacter acidaminivorans]MBP1924529.1 small GTP-binding protein [Sedimentibacter acidaminivorans]